MIRGIVVAVLLALATQTATAAEQLGGCTNMHVDRSRGSQVEYLTRSGKSYLWYPGNKVILEGRWKRQGDQMCFAYGANTYNPATGHRGGGSECTPYRLYWGGIFQRMNGDLFGLEGRREVPFVLSRKRTTLEALLKRASPGAKAPPVELTANTPTGHIALSCESLLANAERCKSHMQIADRLSRRVHGQTLREAGL